MELDFLELELELPRDISTYRLRSFILDKLGNYGVPLRWAITSIKNIDNQGPCHIQIEVIFIKSDR